MVWWHGQVWVPKTSLARPLGLVVFLFFMQDLSLYVELVVVKRANSRGVTDLRPLQLSLFLYDQNLNCNWFKANIETIFTNYFHILFYWFVIFLINKTLQFELISNVNRWPKFGQDKYGSTVSDGGICYLSQRVSSCIHH